MKNINKLIKNIVRKLNSNEIVKNSSSIPSDEKTEIIYNVIANALEKEKVKKMLSENKLKELKLYIRKGVKNRFLNYLTRKKKTEKIRENTVKVIEDPLYYVLIVESNEKVEKMLRNEKIKKAMMLLYYHFKKEMKYRELALKYATNISTIGERIKKAKRYLRSVLIEDMKFVDNNQIIMFIRILFHKCAQIEYRENMKIRRKKIPLLIKEYEQVWDKNRIFYLHF